LYALAQQGSIGDVNTERPGFYQISARPLWDAWNSKKGLSKEEAMSSYIKIVKTYI
jgi:diazepam-binding inhibitor (GABA receptor modulating acyl-CoA-binding protein)